ncbi:MAG: HD domain-containing protein [Clostridium sp.]|nr:HD domain-containing protein [Clostridium sp.]
MKVQELLQNEEIQVIQKEVDHFSEIMLTSYIENLGEDFLKNEPKEIFDSIWGPVEFNVGEIVLLDSPLIQRLRKIKQLGLASYVYCNADYSRFSHTIGAFYLSNEMARIIEKQLDKRPGKYDFVQIVRLAALFHDAGHMYFSHASEKFFTEYEQGKRYKEVKSALTEFSKAIDDNVSLHELISIMIVNSPGVGKLLKKVAPALDGIKINTQEDITEITEYISCLILGQANNEEILPFFQIINGPVDADKCDYLKRDSHATNVPVAVDIFRLIHKLGIEKGELPEKLHNTKLWEEERNGDFYYPIIKSSAIEALNQLLMARSIMYNSVYYHQKVRTAETMFRKVLEGLDKLRVSGVVNFSDILLTTDDAFGYNCVDVFSGISDVNKADLKRETDKLDKINFRFLMKRSGSIEKNLVTQLDDKLGYEFEKDFFMLHRLKSIQMIERESLAQYERICGILGKENTKNADFMIMEFPKVSVGDSIPDATISYGNGEVKAASQIFQAGTWIESKESRNKEQYLVTDCNNRVLAFFALQKALYKKYKIVLGDKAAICSKVPMKELKKQKRELLYKGFYDDALMLVKDILLADCSSEIKDVYKKYQTFEGAQGGEITEEKIYSFLTQFLRIEMDMEKCKKLICGILKILKNGIYINRKCFVQGIEDIFKDTEKVYLCPLGGKKDSAFHMLYYFNDIPGDKFEIYDSLQDAIKRSATGDTVVLFDDGAYSGMQVSSIFQEYMGVPREQRLTDESHVKPLSPREIEKLKKRQISIAYICFNDDNRDFINRNAAEFGMPLKNIRYVNNMQVKIFDTENSIFEDEDERTIVKEALDYVGFQILSSVKKAGELYKENWSLERVKESTLGYSDAQQMVVLQSSVPTYTITAFWCEGGKVDGMNWIPLFSRTKK